MTSIDIDENIEKLHGLASKGKWSDVLEMYKNKTELRTAKITATGDTVLHIAVTSGKEKEVREMVEMVCAKRTDDEDENSESLLPVDENGDEKRLVLGAENDRKNTPLHLAAKMGNVEICKMIGGAEPSLIARRNIAGETSLFVAALHGEEEAFLWLHYLYMDGCGDSSTDYAHCVRDNNDTILHCAIEQGHIDVAIEIIHLYKDLVKEMKRNEDGLSPLHLLAAMPSAFKSSRLHGRSITVHLLYWFFSVEKKNQATTMEELKQRHHISLVMILMLLVSLSILVSSFEFSWFQLIMFLISVMLGFIISALLALPLSIIALFVLAGKWLRQMRKLTEKHVWSLQIMDELLKHASPEEMSKIIFEEQPSTSPKTKEDNEMRPIIVETPLMIAAKNGVIEMVDKILKSFPATIKLVNEEGKNTILLAAEKRQTKVYQFLWENENIDRSLFKQVDKEGNSALHLAARFGVNLNWQTITMVEEFKWFEFVKKSIPSDLWERYNNDGKTAEEIFRDSYGELMASDREWLNQTSEACSVVSTLVASMVFPNVVDNFDDKGYSSLVALSFSLTSTIFFLAILASRSQSITFWKYVPFMLCFGMSFMFGSIVSLWVSLMLYHHSLTTYTILGSPIALIVIISLPIFIGPTLMSIFTKVPTPNRRTTSAIRYRRNKKNNGTYLKAQGNGDDVNYKRRKPIRSEESWF